MAKPLRINPALRNGFKLDDVLVLPNAGTVIHAGKSEHLAPKAMEVLLVMCSNQGELIATEDLLLFGWGSSTANRANLTHVISDIRHALDDHKECPEFIQTITRKGYRVIAHLGKIDEDVKKAELESLPASTADTPWRFSIALLKILIYCR